MIFTTFVAFYTAIQDRIKGNHLYKNIYTTIPLLIDDALTREEAVEIARNKETRNLILNEVREIDIQDKENILKFYG